MMFETKDLHPAHVSERVKLLDRLHWLIISEHSWDSQVQTAEDAVLSYILDKS